MGKFIKDPDITEKEIENLEKESNNSLSLIEKNENLKLKEQKRANKLKDESEKMKQTIIEEFKKINIKII